MSPIDTISMPSSVILRSRRQGRTMNHQMAIGKPTHMRTELNVRKAFMNIGGSDGPPGTRSKYGPVIHRIHTYNWSARTAPPMVAQIVTGLTVR